MTRETLLARTLVDLADTLVADFDVIELLSLLTDRCVDVLDVGAAGLMLVAPEGDLRVMASSNETMRLLELFEHQSQEGPCLDSYRTGEPVLNQNLATSDDQWPRFAPEALATGFASVHRPTDAATGHRDRRAQPVPRAHRRHAAGRRHGRPRDGRRRHHRHPPAPRHLRGPGRQRTAHPRAQQSHRHRAGQGHDRRARGLDMERAFAMLRNHARNHNARLADVARAIIDDTLAATALDRPPPTQPT